MSQEENTSNLNSSHPSSISKISKCFSPQTPIRALRKSSFGGLGGVQASTSNDCEISLRAGDGSGAPTPGSVSSSRLEYRTYFDRPSYNLSVYDFADSGRVEVGFGRSCRQANRAERGRNPERMEENRKRADRRAKTTLRRKCLAARVDHLATLTRRKFDPNRNNWITYIQKFERLVRKTDPEIQLIFVIERQPKRGSWAPHFAFCGWVDVNLFRKLWRQVCPDGNIDISFKPNHSSKRSKEVNLARYISKYIGKEIGEGERGFGQHRFMCSKGIELPVSRIPIYARNYEEAVQRARRILLAVAETDFVHFEKWEHLDEEEGWGFMCAEAIDKPT